MLFYFLEQILHKPGLISIAIAVASTIISSLYLYKIFNLEFSKRLSNYLTYLFLLIPSIQIYYLSSLDAIISALSIGGLYYFIQEKNRGSRVVGTALFLGLCSFLNFGAVLFFVPLFFLYELVKRRSISDSSAILLIIGIGYVILYIALGYNYVNSFFISSSLENPNGFRLLADTTSYIFTRIEGIVEIFVFFTPYLAYLSYKYFNSTSLDNIVDNNFSLLAVLSGIILLGMFGAGVFRTGETARTAIFIYPLLFLPLGKHLYNQNISHQSKVALAIFVFIQALMMQIVGFYFW
jgi:hypothetical protein